MERVSFDIEQEEVFDALKAEAAAHGRTVADEVAELVVRTYAGKARRPKTPESGNWFDELLRLGKGLDLRIPARRDFAREAPDFPEGLEPREGESFIQMIDRVSRPGFDLGDDRDRTPHEGPTL